MYKIILAFCLVLAVAEGLWQEKISFRAQGKFELDIPFSCKVFKALQFFSPQQPEIGKLKNTFDLLKARTEININLAKQRCNPMSLNIERTKIKSAEDSLEKLITLNAELSAIPAKECQNEFKEHLDLKQHCFHPNIPTCKSTMRDCIAEASYQVGGGLLRNAFEDYSYFERHNSIAFDFNIANCTQTYPILNLDYEKCVNDAISSRNIHVKFNQEIFEDEMNKIEDTSKEFVEELQYSVSVFKSRQSKS